MFETEQREIDFDLLCDRFPKHCARIKTLARWNVTFGDICEDYCLADSNLRRFEADPDNKWELEIADFRTVIAELGAELMKFLNVEEASGVGTSSEAGQPNNA